MELGRGGKGKAVWFGEHLNGVLFEVSPASKSKTDPKELRLKFKCARARWMKEGCCTAFLIRG